MRSTHPRRARAVCLWSGLAFLGLQAAFSGAIEKRHPEWYDADYAARLVALKARLSEGPQRPLLLVVGSSRLTMAFWPEVLPPLPTPRGQQLLCFNFSHLGSGPVMNLVLLRRLLRQGIRPDWLLLEVMPPYLIHDGQVWLSNFMEAADLPLLLRYFPPVKTLGRYLFKRLVTGQECQTGLLRRYLPGLAAPDPAATARRVTDLGGPVFLDAHLDRVELGQRAACAYRQYHDDLQHFHITPVADRAVRETLDLCRQHHIKAMLIVAPESSEFSRWYPPLARVEIDRYLSHVRRTYSVPLIDARTWLADSDFFDGHHVVLTGAWAFTQRLGREVLQQVAARSN